MTTAIDLHEFLSVSELFEANADKAVFTVVQDWGKKGLVVATASSFLGIRWQGTVTVKAAFQNFDYCLNGAEAFSAVTGNHNQFPVVILYRNGDELTVFGKLTK